MYGRKHGRIITPKGSRYSGLMRQNQSTQFTISTTITITLVKTRRLETSTAWLRTSILCRHGSRRPEEHRQPSPLCLGWESEIRHACLEWGQCFVLVELPKSVGSWVEYGHCWDSMVDN